MEENLYTSPKLPILLKEVCTDWICTQIVCCTVIYMMAVKNCEMKMEAAE
jgi:hypothetical protein